MTQAQNNTKKNAEKDIVRIAVDLFETIAARGRANAESSSLCECCLAYEVRCDGAGPGELVESLIAECFEAPEDTDCDLDEIYEPHELEELRISIIEERTGRFNLPAAGSDSMRTPETGPAGPPPACGARSICNRKSPKRDRSLPFPVARRRVSPSPAETGPPAGLRTPAGAGIFQVVATAAAAMRTAGSELVRFFHPLILRSS